VIKQKNNNNRTEPKNPKNKTNRNPKEINGER
jgi:hypothetical protein